MKVAAVFAAALACAALVTPASATLVVLNVSGTAGDAGAYEGVLNLNVSGGTVTSASGNLTIAGLVDAPLGLITTSTPYNENNDPTYPVGFRADDGTDLYFADQNYPLDYGGLLFAVGTTDPMPNQNPLINFYNYNNANGVVFTGRVDGTEHYVQSGSLDIVEVDVPAGAAPEPSAWTMLILGFGAAGSALRRRPTVTTSVHHAA